MPLNHVKCQQQVYLRAFSPLLRFVLSDMSLSNNDTKSKYERHIHAFGEVRFSFHSSNASHFAIHLPCIAANCGVYVLGVTVGPSAAAAIQIKLGKRHHCRAHTPAEISHGVSIEANAALFLWFVEEFWALGYKWNGAYAALPGHLHV